MCVDGKQFINAVLSLHILLIFSVVSIMSAFSENIFECSKIVSYFMFLNLRKYIKKCKKKSNY